MPKLLQIDSCLGILSTGKITEGIAFVAMKNGWECHIAHGARCVGKTLQRHYQISTVQSEYFHYAQGLIFDNHGLNSTSDTKRLIKHIQEIKPDIIHLHCIHGYYLNYKILFDYLNSTDIPVVWTFHDCWGFTGHCAYFDSINCEKWKDKCNNCGLKKEYPKAVLLDRSEVNFKLKKSLFCSNNNLTIVPVSHWIGNLTKDSFLKNKLGPVIHNGVDTNIFKPTKNEFLSKYNIKKKVVLGVAFPWSKRKGYDDFIELNQKIKAHAQIVLVGLNKSQISSLPKEIIGIERTTSAEELADIYSSATVFVNPTYSDNFPTTNIESLSCGTPVITYNTGGSPEAIDINTGTIVAMGDIGGLFIAIDRYLQLPADEFYHVRSSCRERAVSTFDKKGCFTKYIELYYKLLSTSHV